MARLPDVLLQPGEIKKPDNLSEEAAKQWDRLKGELEAAGVGLTPAHRAALSMAATIAADITDAWEAIERDGAYELNVKTQTTQAHPATKRLDALRRDYIKVLAVLGLRTPTSGGKASEGLEDILNG